MLYLIILLLITNIAKINTLELPVIYGHFKNGTTVEICINAMKECSDVAESYTVGEGKDEFLIWTPYGEPGRAGEHVGSILARALRDLVYRTRDPSTNEDTLKGRIEVVSWSDVAYKPICQKNDPNSECPTVMLLGTTQFAYRYKLGDIKNLDGYFDRYLYNTHEPLTDRFLKQVYYDYNIDSHFIAVPLILDIRLLYFNRTTFDTLNLEYPPPHGNWGRYSEPYYNSWNWETFVSYIKKIKQSFPEHKAFSFTGQYDEEMKLFHMIIKNYYIETIDEKKNCGYLNNKDRVLEIIEYIIKPLFSQLDDDWYPNNEITNAFLRNNNYIAPEDLPKICCGDTSEYSNGFFGVTIDSPSTLSKLDLYNEDNPNAEIAAGYIPGSSSYLGGSGIAITSYKTERMQNIAWDFILSLIDTKQTYLTEIGIATNMIPPYDSLFDIKYWNEKQWEIAKNQIRHSIQIQYPRQTFPEFGELEDRHPIRLMILEILKKNVNPSDAIDRCCQLMNSVLAGECTDQHWTYKITDCTSYQNRKISFSWINDSCKGGVTLPKDTYIQCSYISLRSGIGSSMVIISVFGIIISLIYMALFIKYRNIESIKNISLHFSIVIILGSIFNYLSIIFNTGYPTEFKCIISKWLIIFGLGLSFGGFVVILKKIQDMYKSHISKNYVVTDIKFDKILIGIIMMDCIALIIWTAVNSPFISLTYNEFTANSRTITYDIIKCKSFTNQNKITLFFIYCFNILTLIYGLWLSYKTWAISQSNSDTKFVCTSIFLAALSLIIIIPFIWYRYSEEINYLIKSLILNFATAVAVSVYCLPKIRSAHYYSKLLCKKKDSNDDIFNPLNKIEGTICCPNCGVLIENRL